MLAPTSNFRRLGLVVLAAATFVAWWSLREPVPVSVTDSATVPATSAPVMTKRQIPQRHSPARARAIPTEAIVPGVAASHSSVEASDQYRKLKQPVRLVEPPEELNLLLKQYAERPDQNAVPEILKQFRQWGGSEGEAAMNYALIKLSGQLRLDSAVEAWRGWAERDLAAASTFAARLLTPGHDYIVYSAAQDFARIDPKAAMPWALHEVPAEYRATASQHVIMQWLRQDPEAALNWTAALAQGRERLTRPERTVVSEAVFYLAGRDVDAAANWVLKLPAGGAFETGTSTLLDRWIDRDPAAAAAWAQSISGRVQAGALDESYATVALRALESNPSAAMAWAELISAEDLRSRTVAQLQTRFALMRTR